MEMARRQEEVYRAAAAQETARAQAAESIRVAARDEEHDVELERLVAEQLADEHERKAKRKEGKIAHRERGASASADGGNDGKAGGAPPACIPAAHSEKPLGQREALSFASMHVLGKAIQQDQAEAVVGAHAVPASAPPLTDRYQDGEDSVQQSRDKLLDIERAGARPDRDVSGAEASLAGQSLDGGVKGRHHAPKKIGMAKQKRIKKALRQAAAAVGGASTGECQTVGDSCAGLGSSCSGPSDQVASLPDTDSISCRVCGISFVSRNKLFFHIKATGHALYTPGAADREMISEMPSSLSGRQRKSLRQSRRAKLQQ